MHHAPGVREPAEHAMETLTLTVRGVRLATAWVSAEPLCQADCALIPVLLLPGEILTMEYQLALLVLPTVTCVAPIPHVLDAEGESGCSPQIRLLVS